MKYLVKCAVQYSAAAIHCSRVGHDRRRLVPEFPLTSSTKMTSESRYRARETHVGNNEGIWLRAWFEGLSRAFRRDGEMRSATSDS